MSNNPTPPLTPEDNWTNHPEKPDEKWAKDVPFLTLEDKIDESAKATREAFKPLGETSPDTEEVNIAPKQKKKPSKGRKAFIIFMAVWVTVLSAGIGISLYYFYNFLVDYEYVYQESLPYHSMDDFMEVFQKDSSDIYEAITNKPETCEYESSDNVIGYINTLLEDKQFDYVEASESTDKTPVYNVTADGYIIGKVTLKQSSVKRAHDLPIYEVDAFEFYTDPSLSVRVKAPETCTIYINDVKVSPSDLYKVDTVADTHFDGYATLPTMRSYNITELYEEPSIKVVSSYGEEITPTFNTDTGVYEVPYSVPKELEDEMIEFAKSAVNTYSKVITRETNNSALYDIFTKDNEIVKSIIANDSSFKWFPNHTTTDIEDEVLEFIPYTDEAFYCEIKHTQHMLIYGVRPSDEVTDTRFYYVKENGSWKICRITY